MTSADSDIERRVGDLLQEEDATVATAESCTGGLIGSLLTDVPG
ncbi:MAG: CinA family protein, partial [Halanaeroarchaeum sp.]